LLRQGGGAPRALLAAEPEAAIRGYLHRARPIVKFTERTLTDPEEILADLLEARERGWVLSEEDVTPGVAALGMAIYGHESDMPVASISLAGLVPHVLGDDRDRFLELLRETADAISRNLGHDARSRLFGNGNPSPTHAAKGAVRDIGAA
jgi:DNA-binding IclR family transcriptional regulator